MGTSKAEGSKREGFFSKLLSGLGVGGSFKETRTRIRDQLSRADKDTLNECHHILAIAVLHEKPWPGQHKVEKVLARWIDGLKSPGWVPFRLMVKAETKVKTIHRPDAASLSTEKSNAILGEWLAIMTEGEDLSGSEAVAFSADNDALGRTYYALLAK